MLTRFDGSRLSGMTVSSPSNLATLRLSPPPRVREVVFPSEALSWMSMRMVTMSPISDARWSRNRAPAPLRKSDALCTGGGVLRA